MCGGFGKMNNRYKIGEGKGIFDFSVQGEAIIVDEPFKFIGKVNSKIIITKSPSPAIYLLMKECAGVVSQNGGIVSHLAIIGMDMNVPVIVGVPDVYSAVKDGNMLQLVSESGKGIVYEIE